MSAPPATLNKSFTAHPPGAGNPQWQPPVPLSAVAAKEIAAAKKWKEAMSGTFAMIGDRRSKSELARLAMPAFQATFRRKITERAYINQLELVIKRDNGRNEWDRLELYLPPKIHSRTDATPAAIAPETRFPAVATHLDTCGDLANLTEAEEAALWLAAFDTVRESDSANRKRVKSGIVDYLFARVPGIAPSRVALEKKFRRRYAEWLAQGEKTLASNRKGRPRGPEISQQTYDAIVAYAVLHREGHIAPAWRDYITGQMPCVTPDWALAEYYGAPENKSYVPRKIRDAIKHEVDAMEDVHHGTYQHGQSAHLLLDDSGMFAGDWWSSDDCTLPVYFYVPSETGYTLMRGQLLLTVDNRTRRILWFNLLPKKSYDSLDIRTHFCQSADMHGLPRKGVIWERGLWKNSKLVKGSATSDFVPADEAELGLRELGVRFIHRHSPKSKIIERVLGALQDRMPGEPGWCGRNEQTERFEEFYKLKLAVESGRVAPQEKLYSFEQWQERIGEICAAYNAEAQGQCSKLAGLSPELAYQQMQNQDEPPVKFGDSARYLLSTHRRPEVMKPNGITFRLGTRKFLYRGGRSGEFIGHKMLIWFSPESPDIAYVTDLDRKNPFAVELVKPLPSVDAPKELLSEEMRKLREHQLPVKDRYRALKTEWKPKFRQYLLTPDETETVRAFTKEREKIENNRDEVQNVNRVAADAGIQLPAIIENPRRVMQGIELRAEFDREQAESRATDSGAAPDLDSNGERPQPKKVYVLNPSPASQPSPALYWALWLKIEKANPGINRHSLTQKAIGCHPKPQEMTPDQLAKMIKVFTAILRDANTAAV
ncbi:MAG TPA: hypothetical protein VH595_22055 [Verrucomicrobiae bacterium]|nr:hypothetical protein [Verrucomicrobiae bacterium]